jgi:hypothetical protein
MTVNGQAYQQVTHRGKHLGRKLGRADADAQREIIGVDHDLQHPGEQEVVSAQGPALPGNQHDITRRTSREQAAHRLQRLGGPAGQGCRAQRRFGVVGAAVVRRVICRGRRHPGGPVVVHVDTLQWRDVRRHRQKLRGPDYLPSQVTGERSDGHLRQGTRHQPLVADLAPLDEVQRDGRGHREHCV